VQCGLVGDGELVGAHGQAAPLLEPGAASFDGVALLVCLGIEAGRAASGAASPRAVSDLVGRLRNDRTDAAPAEMPANRAGAIRSIREDGLRPCPWSSGSTSGTRILAMTASMAGVSPA
jgi:hypothetical protein